MPGSKKIELGAGDACLFHAWGIHRGTYRADVPRRTLDIIYGWGGACDYCPPPPMCFTDQDLLARLSPSARNFFDYFIKTVYSEYWNQERFVKLRRKLAFPQIIPSWFLHSDSC